MGIIKERTLFFKEALKGMQAVGSILPSSKTTAKAMTSAFRYRRQPAHILEVGAGTGPITARIVREMRPEDRLDIYEINPDYTDFLKRRFDTEPDFQRVKDQCRVFTSGIDQIERVPTYDYIISAVPFNIFPPDDVRDFFETYRDILKDDGVLTYIEYALGRQLMKVIPKKDEKQQHLNEIGEIVNGYISDYQVQHEFVFRNAPPAHIRSLQF